MNSRINNTNKMDKDKLILNTNMKETVSEAHLVEELDRSSY